MPNRYRQHQSQMNRHDPLLTPTLTAIYRTLAVGAWVASGILYIFGLNVGPVDLSGKSATPIDFYAASCLTMLLALAFTYRVVVEGIVSATFAREAERSRAFLADAVAEALADELVARGLVLCPDDHDDGARDLQAGVTRIGR